MRLAVLAVGTRGDVQPMLALAAGLRAAGHFVRFVTEARNEKAVLALGFEFGLMRGDSEQFFSGPGGRAFRESLDRPAQLKRFWRNYFAPMIPRHLQDAVAGCAGMDAVVCLPWLGAGPSVGEFLNIPVFFASPLPGNNFPTRAFTSTQETAVAQCVTAEQRWRSWRKLATFTRLIHESLQDARASLGMARQTWEQTAQALRQTPHLLGYSPALLPKPADWPAHLRVTGFWFLDAPAQEPPAELREFLAAGPAPVVVGFGSHVGRDPVKLTRTVVDGLLLCGQRAILIAGWGGLSDLVPVGGWPAHVLLVRSAPFTWLLPQIRAMVHHGGIGTVAECLRAGVPQIIATFGFDQAFWADKVEHVGVGMSLGPAAEMTAATLAAAIACVTSNPDYAKRAAEMSVQVRMEDGVGSATSILEGWMGTAEAKRHAGDLELVPVGGDHG